MKKVAIPMLLIIFLILIPAISLAQMFPGEIDPFKIVFGPNIPQEWYQPYLILQFLIFPFLLIVLVIYGIFSEIRIFRRASINGIIALLIAFVASYSGYLVIFVHWTSTIAGAFGYTAFIVLLFVGIGVWFFYRWVSWGLPWSRKRVSWKGVGQKVKTSMDRDTRLAELKSLMENLPANAPERRAMYTEWKRLWDEKMREEGH